MERFVIDLEDARDNEEYNIKYWKYLYIGDCDGDVELRFNSKRAADNDPTEFNKIEDLCGIEYLIIRNTAQPGKKLVIYYEEIKKKWI